MSACSRCRATTAAAVGRPQHRYSLAADAPSLGLEPPAVPDPGPHAAAGRRPGRNGRRRKRPTPAASRVERTAWQVKRRPCLDALVGELDRLGFDPAIAGDDGRRATIAFAHCPFRELAEANPDLVCSLHRGLVEGFVDVVGAGEVEVVDFHTLVDRTPCQVELVGGSSG